MNRHDEAKILLGNPQDHWSDSCYTYFRDMCSDLSRIFTIDIEIDNSWRLIDLKERIDLLLKCLFDFDCREQIIRLEFILSCASKCLRDELIRNRHFCQTDMDTKNKENEVSEHNEFFVTVCKELSRIYNRYEYELEYANRRKENRGRQLIPNVVQTRFRDVFKKCFKKYRATKGSWIYYRVGVIFY